jgi:hypothetical protein
MTSFSRTAAALVLAGALAAPTAQAAGDGTYKGKITGNTPVTVKVKNNRVTKFTTSLYASCGLSNFMITVAFPPAGQPGRTAKITDGSFRAVFKGSPDVEDDRRTIRGTFTGAKVTGSVKVRGICSADGKYSARR